MSGHPDQTRAQIEALGRRDPADLARIAVLEEEQRRDLADVDRFRTMARGYMDERDRLVAVLACERGERAPEGWEWEWQTRRWIKASIPAVASAGSWFIGIDGPSGAARYLLECVEAADAAAKATADPSNG